MREEQTTLSDGKIKVLTQARPSKTPLQKLISNKEDLKVYKHFEPKPKAVIKRVRERRGLVPDATRFPLMMFGTDFIIAGVSSGFATSVVPNSKIPTSSLCFTPASFIREFKLKNDSITRHAVRYGYEFACKDFARSYFHPEPLSLAFNLSLPVNLLANTVSGAAAAGGALCGYYAVGRLSLVHNGLIEVPGVWMTNHKNFDKFAPRLLAHRSIFFGLYDTLRDDWPCMRHTDEPMGYGVSAAIAATATLTAEISQWAFSSFYAKDIEPWSPDTLRGMRYSLARHFLLLYCYDRIRTALEVY